MKKSILALLALLMLSTNAFALDWAKCEQKMARATRNWDSSYQLSRKYKSCKQFGDELVLITRSGGDIVTVDLNGSYSGNIHKYSLYSDVVEDKIIAEKVFIVTTDGKLFFMNDDNRFYEIQNSRGRSYNLEGIKGKANDASVVVLEHRGSQPTDLEARYINRNLRPVYFYPTFSWADFFRY
jgi:hypothetical protein